MLYLIAFTTHSVMLTVTPSRMHGSVLIVQQACYMRLMALTYCKVTPLRKSEVIEIGLTEQRGDDVPVKLTVICHGGCWGVASMG